MFGELAVRSGAMTEDELVGLLYHQTVRGKPISLILAELGFAEADDLEDHFSEYRTSCGARDKREPVASL